MSKMSDLKALQKLVDDLELKEYLFLWAYLGALRWKMRLLLEQTSPYLFKYSKGELK